VAGSGAILTWWVATSHGLRILPNSWWWCTLLTQLPVFLGGLALWRAQQSVGRNGYRIVLGFGLAAALITPLLWRLAWKPADPHGWSTLAAMLLPGCFGSVCMAVVELLRRCKRFPRWLLSVGRASFSIYLLHFISAWALAGWLDQRLSDQLPGFLRLALYASGSLGLAWLIAQATLRLIERPGIRVGERLIAHCWPRVAT
jgi:peptidoglycan/LPS O-acetylase OafA/YrhL